MSRKVDPTDILGCRYGKVVVTEYLGILPTGQGLNGERSYLCQCDCGNSAIAKRSQIMRGKRKTCGDCTRIEKEDDHYRYYDNFGRSFVFDEEDLPLAESRTWRIAHNGYAKACDTAGIYVFSRIVMNAPDGMDVDHVDGDRQNDRKSNLRIVTRSENLGNQRLSSRNTSGYKGVSYLKSTGMYRSYINFHGKRYELGRFNKPEDAARAYDEAARYYFGEFACVNFPREGEQGCRRNQELKKEAVRPWN